MSAPRPPLDAEQRKLAEQYIPLVESILIEMFGVTPGNARWGDLRQAGFERVCRAAPRYDASKAGFAAYLRACIPGAIRDAFRKEAKHWPAARVRAEDEAANIGDSPTAIFDDEAATLSHLDGALDGQITIAGLGVLGGIARQMDEEGEHLREVLAPVFAVVETTFAAMPPKEAAAVRLRNYETKSWAEVAEAMGVGERQAQRYGAEGAKSFAAVQRKVRQAA